MKKLKWNRKLSILVLIMFVTVSFASFNTNLFIDGKAYVRVDKDIRITNIRLLESEYNGYENTNSEYTNHSISTDVSLPRQASSVTYEVTVSNVSDRRYKITDIIEDSYDNKDVKYELIDASIGNIVEPHTEKTFKVKFTNNVTVVEEDDVYQTLTYTFNYTGGEQEFIVPYDGDYTLEVWGAQGGSAGTIDGVTYTGGYGGYSKGSVTLKKNEKIYINVGGAGSCVLATTKENYSNGGYNGGGNGSGFASTTSTFYSSGGGGATHISIMKGQLSKLQNYTDSILIVAGGGGGNGYVQRGACVNSTNIPSGGGIEGSSGNYNSNYASTAHNGSGGTQTTGYAFGKGQSCDSNGVCDGAGAGYYGGYRGFQDAGGGSGYIGNEKLSNKAMFCYQCTESTEPSTKTTTTNNHSPNPTSEYAKEGNGYAKITLTRKINDGSEYDFDYTGGEQTFTAPYTGVYQLETWGAQGGNISCENNNGYVCMDNASKSYKGGYGGYSRGTLNLSKDDSLYINIGGQGKFNADYGTNGVSGGYNGGGDSYGWLSKALTTGSRMVSSGGGATHIALVSGLLNSLENQKDKIIMVSGGGAGAWYFSNPYRTINVGNAGGFIGGSGEDRNGVVSGGTQTGPGNLGGTLSTFGQGAGLITAEQCGGGGGYYGGNSSTYAGGGGSGYIGNDILKEKIMYCYDCEESQDINTRTVSTKSHSKIPKQNVSKEGNGYSRITLIKRTINQTKLTLDFTFEEYVNGSEFTFGYTGEPQEFVVPKTGYYKVELWGASGDNYKNDYIQEHKSFAAYTSGKIKLNKGEHLYVYVGGQSKRFNSSKDSIGGISGGATDIRLKETENWYDLDSLSSRIMVAAGSGQTYNDQHAKPSADAGGLTSYGIPSGGNWEVNITTQTAGGIGSHARSSTLYTYDGGNGEFGIGGTAANQITAEGAISGSAYNSGAGGYYGGGGGPSGGSGSSFISGHNGCVAIVAESDTTPRNDSNGNQCADGTTDITCSKHYSNYIFTDTKMIDGKGYEWTTEVGTEVVGMPTHDGTSTMTGNDGDGFAKITCLEEVTDYSFDYTGDVQEFVAPYNGIYKVELWGAQGGSKEKVDSGSEIYSGLGGYVSGNIELKKNNKLNIYVGMHQQKLETVFNGGASGESSGGGATDIRINNGNWNSFDSLKSRIMVAAGGGGGIFTKNITGLKAGDAGGLIGNRAEASYYSSMFTEEELVYGFSGFGGTQIQGGLVGGTDSAREKIANHFANLIEGATYSYTPTGFFGKGGYGSTTQKNGSGSASGGGGGYFGGGWGAHPGNAWPGGGGGSSYISGHPGCVSITENSTSDNITFVNDSNGVACNDENSTGYNSLGYNTDSACNKHYSGYTFTDTVMIDGRGYSWDENGVGNTIVGMPSPDGRTTMVGNKGNGYARITLIEKQESYKIEYDTKGGTISNEKKTYSPFDDNIELKIPKKDGYAFTGWTGGKNLLDYNKLTTKTRNKVDETGLVKSINETSDGRAWYFENSDWKQLLDAGEYTVSLFFEKVPTSDSAKSAGAFCIKTIDNDSEFSGCINYGTDMRLFNKEKVSFTFTLEESKEVGIMVKAYDGQYRIQLEKNSNPTKWEPYISTPTKVITIPKGSKGNRIYQANWITTSELIGSKQVNTKMKKLAKGSSSSFSTVADNITSVEYRSTIPEEAKIESNRISKDGEEYPTYIYLDGSTICWYTEAETISLDSDGTYLFYNFTTLEYAPITTKLYTFNVTSLDEFFSNCWELKEIDLTGFDTTNVTSMYSTFYRTRALTELDLSSFNTSKVEVFRSTFNEMLAMETIDISNFDTSSATNMIRMFYSCKALKTVYVSNKFVTAKVTESSAMFTYDDYLVGQAGTVYSTSHQSGSYARIDNPPDSPGYFTLKQ